MSQMHEAMVQKIEARHVDITEELANIEKNNEKGEEDNEKKEWKEHFVWWIFDLIYNFYPSFIQY